MEEPLGPVEARQLILRILEGLGTLSFSRHAAERAEQRGLSMADCLNVLKGGKVDESRTSFEQGSWRYCVSTPKMAVVVAFTAEDRLVIVTAMRRDP